MQVEQVQTKRTRAEVMRDKVKIRLATDEAGPLIADVLKENGVVLPNADWSKVFPHWLIATVEDDVIGCCQVLVAKPVGFVEFLFVKPSASFKLRAIAMRKLILQSMGTLKAANVSYCGAVVKSDNGKFLDVLDKLTFIHAGKTELLAKRLAD